MYARLPPPPPVLVVCACLTGRARAWGRAARIGGGRPRAGRIPTDQGPRRAAQLRATCGGRLMR
jgi:hypothetical protein